MTRFVLGRASQGTNAGDAVTAPLGWIPPAQPAQTNTATMSGRQP